MRSRGLFLAVTALSAATALGACSGDDSDGGDQPKSAESPSTASESPTFYPVDGCQAAVSVSGALKVKWKGNGMVSPSGEATLYQSSNEKGSWITITTATDDAAPQMALTVVTTTYAVSDVSVDIGDAGDELSATALVDATEGKTARVKAKFDCENASR